MEMWVQSLGWEDSLEKEMATYSSVLAGENPNASWGTEHCKNSSVYCKRVDGCSELGGALGRNKGSPRTLGT